MSDSKKAVSISNNKNISDTAVLERLEQLSPNQAVEARGIGGNPLYEPVPNFVKSSTEKVFENGHNAWIVLGRDRPAGRLSGYGGRGHTQTAMIDIVVGRMGHAAKSFAKDGQRLWVDNDQENDAARIYISQKTDVDENFKLADGNVGNIKTRAAIALKADELRFIARGGIKIISKAGKTNSQGGEALSMTGIDIIAGNDDSDLQPMVKGNNLTDALKKIVHHIEKLNGIVDSLLNAQMLFNTALTSHFHTSPFLGLPTSPSPVVIAAGIKTMVDHLMQTKLSLLNHRVNLVMYKKAYLSPVGKKFVNSRFNNVN